MAIIHEFSVAEKLLKTHVNVDVYSLAMAKYVQNLYKRINRPKYDVFIVAVVCLPMRLTCIRNVSASSEDRHSVILWFSAGPPVL